MCLCGFVNVGWWVFGIFYFLILLLHGCVVGGFLGLGLVDLDFVLGWGLGCVWVWG